MTTKAMTTTTNGATLATLNDAMTSAGKAANKAAQRHAFDNALTGKADNTIKRKRADLALFELFLNSVNVPAHDLYSNPEAWRGVTWGIVEAYKKWMLQKGYAIASVNGRLSTVRNHAQIAAQAGTIDDVEARMIASVKSYTHKESKRIDDQRSAAGIETRRTTRSDGTPATMKKSAAVNIPDDVYTLLTTQPNTPQGRRDALLMCLLLDHGLRVSEIALLTPGAFDMKRNTFTFYRPKVDKVQTHTLSANTRKAAAAYIKHDAPAMGILWRKSFKGTGKLGKQLEETSATRALTKRVELLGRHAGVNGLSAHDARHYCATYEANNNTTIKRMMDMFGWNSPAMATRYIASAEIANDGTARVKAAQ